MTITPDASYATSNKSASTSWAPSFSGRSGTDIAVGDLIVVTVGRDDATTDSASPTDTLTDNKGNTYTKATGISVRSAGGSGAGIIFYCNAAQAITTSETWTLTWTFEGGASITAKAISIQWFKGAHPTAPLGSVYSMIWQSGVVAPLAWTYVETIGWLVVGGIVIEGPSGDNFIEDTDTTGGTWTGGTTAFRAGTTGGQAITNITTNSAYKVVTATGNQNYNPTPNSGGTGREGVCLIAEFKSANIVSLTPAAEALSAPAVTPVPGQVTVSLTSSAMTLTAVVVSVGGNAVSLTPAIEAFAAVALTAVPGQITVSLTSTAEAFSAIALSPVPQAVTMSLASAVETMAAVAVTPEPQPVTVGLIASAATFAAVALTPVPQPVVVALTPATEVLTAPELTGQSAINLAASAYSFSAPTLMPVPGQVSVNLQSSVAAFIAPNVTPQPQSVTVNLTWATVTFIAPFLSLVGGVDLTAAIVAFVAPTVAPEPQSVTVSLSIAGLILAAPTLSPIPGTTAVTLVSAAITFSAVPFPSSVGGYWIGAHQEQDVIGSHREKATIGAYAEAVVGAYREIPRSK